MTAAKQAKAIENQITDWSVYREVQARAPMVSELPLPNAPDNFGIIINLTIQPEFLSLKVIFDLTVNALHWINNNGQFAPFDQASIRVLIEVRIGDPERIFILNAPVNGIRDIPIERPEGLLENVSDRRYTSYWYCDKSRVLT